MMIGNWKNWGILLTLLLLSFFKTFDYVTESVHCLSSSLQLCQVLNWGMPLWPLKRRHTLCGLLFHKNIFLERYLSMKSSLFDLQAIIRNDSLNPHLWAKVTQEHPLLAATTSPQTKWKNTSRHLFSHKGWIENFFLPMITTHIHLWQHLTPIKYHIWSVI